ncbi:MAG: sporulation transcription factor Spo0A [Clostridia bacterium]|nr:sporulation transcription factor Spo0A [Clostridia bacterium]
MKEEISVLIVDDNVEFGDLLNEYINQTEGINVIGKARDGLQAIEMIQLLKPDVVILDVVMPNLDGIGVLEKVNSMQLAKKPLFIMLSAIGQDLFVQQAIALGAEYYIVKPFDIDVLISRIRQIYRERLTTSFTDSKLITRSSQQKPKTQGVSYNLEVEVTGLMRDIGIPPNMAGYQYIREAIILTINNAKLFSSITKVLYPEVAKKFNTTPQKVERSIRSAIESAWNRGNADSIDALFGYTINYSRGKPTNSEFIAMMADRIRINLGIAQRNDL